MLKQMKNTLFKKKTFSILYHEPKIMFEQTWTYYFLIKIIVNFPLFWVKKILTGFKMMCSCEKWNIVWNTIIRFLIIRYNQNSLKFHELLIHLGEYPICYSSQKYRHVVPYWWVIASHGGSPLLLKWFKTIYKKNENQSHIHLNFLYISFLSKNDFVFKWYLENYNESNETDILGNSMLAHIMEKTSPENNIWVNALVKANVDWSYQMGGKSGFDILKTDPYWDCWYIQQHILNISAISSKNKKI